MTATQRDARTQGANARKRLTVDLDPELHLRIKIAAAKANLSMRDYLEEILNEAVPPSPESVSVVRRSTPITAPNIFERLAKTRQALSGGRVVSDSTEIIRRMRDEQSDWDEKR
ncbi:MAG TPA: hypothetical protein VF120_03490 [Ktedonobacterales bacterium]